MVSSWPDISKTQIYLVTLVFDLLESLSEQVIINPLSMQDD
jgi:hypothetical protein